MTEARRTGSPVTAFTTRPETLWADSSAGASRSAARRRMSVLDGDAVEGVDDDHVEGEALRDELQPELLLDGGED